VLKEASVDMGQGPIIRTASRALKIGPNDAADLLEISGTASAAVLAYVAAIREYSLELCGGNRTSPEKLSGAQSGRAMELMNQSLIWLANQLRTSYGEGALMSLLKMVLAANRTVELTIGDQKYKRGGLPAPDSVTITLKWPPWYQPTAADHSNEAGAIKTYRDAGVLSRESGVRFFQHDLDIEDVDAELDRIEEDLDADSQREIKTAVESNPHQPIREAA
jgi:hypothetical protein